MTYLSQETSVEAGRPIDLYEFRLGSLLVFRYTSADDDQVFGGGTFERIAISRGRVGQGAESRKAALEVEMPADGPFASRYVTGAPSEQATLVLRQLHRADGQAVTLFEGVVKTVSFGSDGRIAKVAVDPPIVGVSQQLPRFTFRSKCSNVLGDGHGGGPGLCTVDLEDPAFRLGATCTAQSGLTMTVPGAAGFGDGFFNGGTVETSAGFDARMVVAHTGDVLTLHVPFPFLVVGSTVVVRAGCAHDATDCGPSKFTIPGGTHDPGEYQGFAYVPTRNPFQSGLGPEKC